MAKLWRALRSLAGFALLAALAVAAVGYYQQRDVPREQLPPLAGTAIDGSAVDLQKMASRGPVLIYFWATWCGYCRGVSPVISDLSSEYQVISVAMQSGSDAEVLDYQRRKSLDFLSINDPRGVLSHAWGVRVTPTVVIVGSDGEVSWVASGLAARVGLKLRMSVTE